MAEAKINTARKCFHCGGLCPPEPIMKAEKAFCCSGCRIVFELLDEHNLCTYYELEAYPGISLDEKEQRETFAVLDDNNVLKKLIDFSDDTTTHITLSIPAIHCTSCVWLLENLHQLLDGVIESRVHFLRKELSVVFRHHRVSLRDIAELLAKTGYKPALQMQNLDGRSSARQPDRRLWLQLGVAGFSFGNIMLLSFPEYLTGTGIDSSMQTFFGLLSVGLALPVLFYSSIDYFKSAWSALLNRGINLDVPIALGISALFGRSLFEIISGTGTGYLDSFTGFVFLLLIGRLLQKKTFDHLNFDRDYRSYFPISSLLVEGDGEKAISVDQIEPGDCLRIRNREIIPVDAVLQEDAYIDYSFVTGESDPVFIETGELVYAGGRVTGTSAKIRATKKVNNSRLTELWNRRRDEQQPDNAFTTEFADRISPWFTYGVITVAAVAAGYWMIIDAGLAANVFTAVLIVACPCALALSGPFTLGSGMNILSSNGLFVKNTSAVERLAQIDTIIFDKTGTLTRQHSTEIEYEGRPVMEEDGHCFEMMFRQSVHPMSRSVLDHIEHIKLEKQQSVIEAVAENKPAVQVSERDAGHSTSSSVTDFTEIAGKGMKAQIADKTCAAGSYKFLKTLGWKWEDSVPERTKKGSEIYIGIDGSVKGCLTLYQPYRKGIKKVLKRLRQNFDLHLLTGDNDHSAEFLRPLFNATSKLKYNQTPGQKQQFINRMKEQGRRILMIGDGLNDAGAIRSSHFGVSLTEQISSFSPACDAIMEASLFDKLDDIVSFGRGCIKVIWVSFGISLLYNVIGLGFAVTGALTPLVAAILMPLSSLSVMIFTTLSTRFAASKRGLTIWK